MRSYIVSSVAATALVMSCASAKIDAFAAFGKATCRVSERRAIGRLEATSNKLQESVFGLSRQIQKEMKGAVSTAALAALLWSCPTAILGTAESNDSGMLQAVRTSLVADAKEMASGTGSRVNKDPESLLRYGLPIPNDKEVRQMQRTIESIRTDVGSKRKSSALDGVKKTRQFLKSKGTKFSSACRDSSACTSILTQMSDQLDPLEAALKESLGVLNGSEQERNALDKAYTSQDLLQKQLTDLEEQMIPAGYVTPVPDKYDDLPQLKGGRATVEFVVRKPNKEPFNVQGANYPEARMKMVIDGYGSPVTSGNFIDLVQKGFYNNMKIQRADGFVVQTGNPDGEAEGYVGGKPSKSIGAGKHGERLIPSEIFVKGDKGPFYETTIEDEERGGQATVLPFSSYGAMGWAREEYDPNSGSSQFFWLLFESDLTPAGKNVLDGRYPCFGYVVEGADFLRDMKEEDVIVSAKVLEGGEKLVQPKDD